MAAMRGMAWCGRWVDSPPWGMGWRGRGAVTCSCAGPSAGGASPGAGPGSSHRPQWGLGLAPEPPAAPGSGSSGTDCRNAPLPVWMGTAGQEAPGLVETVWETDPIREAIPPGPCFRVQGASLEGLCTKHVGALGTGLQATAHHEGVPAGACPGGVPPPLPPPAPTLSPPPPMSPTPHPHPRPHPPAPCSCAPFAVSGPTASSSPGPGSQVPPHLRSPGSLLRTRDLRPKGRGGEGPRCRAQRAAVRLEKVLLPPRHLMARGRAGRAPAAQEPCLLALTLPLHSCATSAESWHLSRSFVIWHVEQIILPGHRCVPSA